ncbi:MAG: glutathione S-transferase [Hydrogenophaga sp.]|uniref:glutathione S-transferase family protein n=1 Tax=Hydrogenophaga sp. TaxID=1904254 RepID=UPI0016944431|nr:glutathione S-transferase family protein [Hydrogenophaga sp.]NIM40038.1 glutathione S-transferase [Hydrogenophaga sp.]NIN25234.1 glutathione S-transferase [Hydrogenophaga sp.]NIN29801.1 glutathione S-transferase [Hydrogenophaga sp.]NIN54273.1 glutathione S-transferase [Hydrogenophaga sp.]NIO50686.1 glutathione S-transferase [Hydrogenophaga sp.]
MIRLHFYPSTAAMVPHILLEELGVPYERARIDREHGALDSPAYRALNPNGLIPVLEDGDLVLYETAAICLHLSDTHPEAKLMPALGTPERAQAYKWLMWLTNTLQATLIVYFYPHRWVNEAGSESEAEIKAVAKRRVGAQLDQLDAELARHGGPWFLGEAYSLLDAYVFTLCRWTRHFSPDSPVRPARERPHLGPYLQRVLDRPALRRVMTNEGLAEPWV